MPRQVDVSKNSGVMGPRIKESRDLGIEEFRDLGIEGLRSYELQKI